MAIFTVAHVALSLIGIVTGLVALGGFLVGSWKSTHEDGQL